MRILLIITISKFLHFLLRCVGRNGDALPGMLALKLCPGILGRMAEGMHCYSESIRLRKCFRL